jgi:hypothetical protein
MVDPELSGTNKKNVRYLFRYFGLGESEDDWIFLKDLNGCRESVEDYHRRLGWDPPDWTGNSKKTRKRQRNVEVKWWLLGAWSFASRHRKVEVQLVRALGDRQHLSKPEYLLNSSSPRTLPPLTRTPNLGSPESSALRSLGGLKRHRSNPMSAAWSGKWSARAKRPKRCTVWSFVADFWIGDSEVRLFRAKAYAFHRLGAIQHRRSATTRAKYLSG